MMNYSEMVVMISINGNAGNDVISGGSGNDAINGNDGKCMHMILLVLDGIRSLMACVYGIIYSCVWIQS